MTAQRAGADNVESEKAALESSENGATSQSTSLVSQLLQDAKEMGHDIGEAKVEAPAAEPAESEETEQTADEETEQTEAIQDTESDTETESETDTEDDTETETESDDKGKDVKHASIEDQIKAYIEKGEKPPWHLTRIAEQTAKLQKRTKERDTALLEIERLGAVEKENADLRQKLETAPKAAASGTPLDNVWSEADADGLTNDANRLLMWLEDNPDGGEFVVGKKKDGTDNIVEIDGPKHARAIKLATEQTLRMLPVRLQKVKEFQQRTSAEDAEAATHYPEYTERGSDLSKFAAETLRDIPALRYVPNIKTWIGDAMLGQSIRLARKNGKKAVAADPDKTKRIVSRARESSNVAPSSPKPRGIIPRVADKADLEKTDKNLKEKGDTDAGVAWLEARGIGGGNQSKKVARVE